MMKKEKTGSILKIMVSFLVIIFLFPACRPFQALEYKGLSDWQLEPRSFAESRLSATALIYNPNKYPITVKRIEADITVNEKTWSNYLLDSTFSVPAESQFSFPIKLKVKNSHLLSGISRLASGNNLPYKLHGKIKGAYRSITAEIPFEYSGQFTDKDIRF